MSNRDPGPIPDRWINCPSLADSLIIGRILAFKTPLKPEFYEKENIPKSKYFTPAMVFSHAKQLKLKLGLWIDLTNTSRFYDKREIEKMHCKYVKLQCRGHGEAPTKELTEKFVQIVDDFLESNDNDLIGVHCTHGFNRTGFLITAFRIETGCTLGAALKEFAECRKPGIYKQDYIDELFDRFKDDEDVMITAPPRPDWCFDNNEVDYAQSSSSSQSSRKRKREKIKSFEPHVEGVELVTKEPLLTNLRKKAQTFCKWKSTNFPGSQPVSMDMENIHLLVKNQYMVSWKADGVRYMMLIDGEDQVYMFDRDNCVFHVRNLRFFHNTEGRHLRNTMLDGEMVIDTRNGVKIIRYLCYDVIKFEGQSVGKEPFWPTRLMCIEKEIVNPRNRAIEKGKINKNAEPFRVVLKQFWDVKMAYTLLEEKFARTLSHEPDGLIFQPSVAPYVAGPCPSVLKWKPPELNSIDFKLKIVHEHKMGMLPERKGELHVGNSTTPFAAMNFKKELKEYDNKIIECKYNNGRWEFMRERTDKSFPNKYETAVSVMKSILNPVTQDYLLSYIRYHALSTCN